VVWYSCSWVENNHALKSKNVDLEFDLKITCHRDGLMSLYCRKMNDMSPDGIWDCDNDAKEDRHYGGQ